jgi:hypothetical protein
VIYDRDGRYPEFVEHFHKLLARSQNALRGRWENFWSSEQVCVVRLIDREAVIDKLVYTATHPVQDQLVNRVHHWPGVNGLAALLHGRTVRARRPLHFFRPNGPMPDEVEMRFAIPPELGSEVEVLAELRQRVHAVEAEHEAERRRTGRQVLGRRAVLQQSYRAYPSSVEPRRNLRPQVAGRSKWSRIEALLRNRAFIEEYARARESWGEGSRVAFPLGTYWLRRFANAGTADPRRTPSSGIKIAASYVAYIGSKLDAGLPAGKPTGAEMRKLVLAARTRRSRHATNATRRGRSRSARILRHVRHPDDIP